MDLAFNEVVGLLNISAEELEAWVKESKIPAYKVQNEYFFSKEVIDNWLMENPLQGRTAWEKENHGSLQYALFRAIHKGEVLHEVPGSSKEEIIAVATQAIAQKIDVEPKMLESLLLEREQLMSTGLGNGIAVPHTRDFLLSEHQDLVYVVFPKEPLEYGALDEEKVEVLFFLLACEDKRHLHLLSKIAHLSLVPASLAFLKAKPTKHEILHHIRSWEGQLKGKKTPVT